MALNAPTWMVDEGITSLGGALYTLGGRNQGGNSALAYRFDGSIWTTIAPLPRGIPSASAVNDGTRIYVLGRSDYPSFENVLFMYNPQTNAYTKLAPFDVPTSAHSVVYLNGRIYKFCGKLSDNFFDTTGVLEIYDIATNSWTIGAVYPLSASSVGAFAQGGFIYAAGGLENNKSQASKACRYDPDRDYWDDTAIPDLPATRWGAAAAAFAGGGILAGGYMRGNFEDVISASVVFWDAASNSWLNLPNMSVARFSMGGAVLNGSYYVVGGRYGSSNTGTAVNEKFTCPIIPTPTPIPTATPLPGPAQPVNLSTRMRVETGDRVLIGGFIINSGSAVKWLAIRGLGPSLQSLGVPVLADPRLQLFDRFGSLFSSNDDWQNNPSQAMALDALGLGLPDSRESGIFIGFGQSSGLSVTAILSGANGGTGVGILEIYDTNPGAGSQLANISTRGFVETGDNVMIGGFILGHYSDNTHVVVRGIGPSLSQSGVSPALADPTVELHNSDGALLVTNDNWQDDTISASYLTLVGLAPTDPKESGIYMLLPAGAFTAILAGKNGGTGIGLIEIYNVNSP